MSAPTPPGVVTSTGRLAETFARARSDGRATLVGYLPAGYPSVEGCSISSDWLFPPPEVRATAQRARGVGARARYAQNESLSGHDSFLKDWAQLREAVAPLLDR